MPVTLDQIKKGSRSESLNFGWMEVVSDPYPSGVKQGGWKVDVRFDDTGTVRRGVQGRYFTGGYVRDGSVVIDSPLSKEFQTFDSGIAKIIEYQGTKNVTVEFLNSGNVQKVQLDALVSGAVRDQSLDEYVREQQKCFDEMVRKARAEADRQRQEEKHKIEAERKVEQELKKQQSQEKRDLENKRAEEHKKKVAANREAKISNLNKLLEVEIKVLDQERDTKGVLNIDFKDRDGNWVLRFKRGEEFVQTRLGKIHNNMTQRVRNGKESTEYYKSYKGVEISEMFQDAQKFCDWAVVQKGWGHGYNLDKDLLSGGAKTYSEDTCCFIPAEINHALVVPKKSKVKVDNSGYYSINMTWNGKDIVVPGFETKNEALEAYCKYRESYVRKLATEYREAISEKAYDTLMHWKMILSN